MFDIGWSEMLVIACLAILVIGPKQLPAALRTLGFWLGKARRMAREFQGHVDDMVAQAELDDVKQEVNAIANFDINEELKTESDAADTKAVAAAGVTGLENDAPDPHRYAPDDYQMAPSNSIVPPIDEEYAAATTELTDDVAVSDDEDAAVKFDVAAELNTVAAIPDTSPEPEPIEEAVQKERAGS